MNWEHEIAGLLDELSGAQTELLTLLAEKQRALVTKDLQRLAGFEPREADLIRRLRACHQRRGELLARAAEAELPSGSIRGLALAVVSDEETGIGPRIEDASGRSRLLAHQSLTNWVFVQRWLLHLSQLLEIIATGGRLQPTYGKEGSAGRGGSIVDRAA